MRCISQIEFRIWNKHLKHQLLARKLHIAVELGPPVVLVLEVPAAAAAVGGVECVSAEPGLDDHRAVLEPVLAPRPPRPRPRSALASLLRYDLVAEDGWGAGGRTVLRGLLILTLNVLTRINHYQYVSRATGGPASRC